MSKKNKLGIIAESGYDTYNIQQLKNIGIYLFTAKNSEDIQNYKKKKAFVQSIKTYYILGSQDFCRKMEKQISDIAKSQKATYIKFPEKSIDDVMKKEKLNFPDVPSESEKKDIVDKSKTETEKIIEKFSDSGLSESDIMGVIMAAEELEEMQIFPNTDENIYNAFLKLAETYILNEQQAKKAVDIFLQAIN